MSNVSEQVMKESSSREHSLAPTLLLSMPQLLDPNFQRSVILLCEHGAEGAFGLVLNRPTETPAADVVGLNPKPVSTVRFACGLVARLSHSEAGFYLAKG